MIQVKTPQEIFLDLIECAGRWNSFDGPAITAALRANRSLWRAVAFGNPGGNLQFNTDGEVCGVMPNMKVLGGLLEGELHCDTLWAIPTVANADALYQLLEHFRTDSIRWLPLEECIGDVFGRVTREEFTLQGYNPDQAVLEAWWD